MSGLYIHIPFCKQACHYCNFHFSTSLKYKEAMLEAMWKELELQKDYLSGPLETIYFGGGTPSLLSTKDLNAFFEKITEFFQVPPAFAGMEITLEANPDDLTAEKIAALKQTPINRLSIGIQSFFDQDLRFMNRAHDATEAHTCIENAKRAGFENLTIDLIYGIPVSSDVQWEQNLDYAIRFDIPHLSCYCLTVEPKTALAHFVKTGKVQPVDEVQAARQFDILLEKTTAAGYEQYEISNFAKPGWIARHNASYWQGKKYLGIGPSAHSFDGKSRQWNVAHNAKYLKALQDDRIPFEKEILTDAQRYNEYVMTALRTSWGCDLDHIRHLGFDRHFLLQVKSFVGKGWMLQEENIFRLSRKGKFMADGIAAELFVL